jgi:hypothetical protein
MRDREKMRIFEDETMRRWEDAIKINEY